MAARAAAVTLHCSAAAGHKRVAATGLAAPPLLHRHVRWPLQPQPQRTCAPGGWRGPWGLRPRASGDTVGSWLDDGIEARAPVAPDPALFGADLAPIPEAERTFSTWDMTGAPAAWRHGPQALLCGAWQQAAHGLHAHARWQGPWTCCAHPAGPPPCPCSAVDWPRGVGQQLVPGWRPGGAG